VHYRRVKHLPPIRIIPYELWDEIKLLLPPERANKTIGRPAIHFRKVLDGILDILRTGCQWKMLPKEYGSAAVCSVWPIILLICVCSNWYYAPSEKVNKVSIDN
jgi:hypothetical protein